MFRPLSLPVDIYMFAMAVLYCFDVFLFVCNMCCYRKSLLNYALWEIGTSWNARKVLRPVDNDYGDCKLWSPRVKIMVHIRVCWRAYKWNLSGLCLAYICWHCRALWIVTMQTNCYGDLLRSETTQSRNLQQKSAMKWFNCRTPL